MKKFLFYSGVISAIPMLLTGCIDKDYDLDNLDKTSDIRIDNLVLPMNLDAITLKDILDVDADSKIQAVTIDGKEFYAVTQHGEFNSQAIDIPQFGVNTPDVAPTNATFDLFTPMATKAASDPVSFEYHLHDFTSQKVEFNGTNIDESVKALYSLTSLPANLSVTLTAIDVPSFASVSFSSITLNILKGLKFSNIPSNYNYDPNTGVLAITNLDNSSNITVISLNLEGIDLTKYDTNVTNGVFAINDQLDITSSVIKVEIDPTKIPANYTPNNIITFSVKTNIDDLTVTHVSGEVEYKLEGDGLNIAPVDLTDIPDFLNQDGSNLKLANPQIYINLNNPVAPYNLYYQTGLKFTAVRESGSATFEPDNNKLIATRPNNAGPYNFLLAPSQTTPLPDYSANLEFIQFSSLSNLLSGNGLPDAIDIELINPGIPLQSVIDFELGKQIDGISGTYDFLAPIALNDGSVIVYSDKKDGWYSDDLDKLTIDVLQVDADVTTTLPLEAKLTAYPIDINGNRINQSKAEIILPANANGDHITIKMEGPIKDLDGIEFTAIVTPGSNEALAPSQTITLKNLKAKVSGVYTFDLDDDDDND